MQHTDTKIITAMTEAYTALLEGYRGDAELIQAGQVEFKNVYHEIFDNFDQFIEMVALYDAMAVGRDSGIIQNANQALAIVKACHPHRAAEVTTVLMFVYAAVYEQRTHDAMVELEKIAGDWMSGHYFQTGNSTIH